MWVYFHWKKHTWTSLDCEVLILTPDSQQQTTKCVKYCDTPLYHKEFKKEKNLNPAFGQVTQQSIDILFKIFERNCSNSLSSYVVKLSSGIYS